ncbi:hypothetical protein Pelo_17605 [Pelomyxa schiedti]|nr:hypothetical protein Pelo_17605 [Pelomyxa schiedti]
MAEGNRQPQQRRPRPFASQCTLAAPEHILRACDQLVVLLLGLVAPRCAARSAAATLTHPIIIHEIGARYVMHVDRRIAIGGRGLVVVGEDDEEETPGWRGSWLDVVFVGISLTLGVVERWARGRVDDDAYCFAPLRGFKGWVGKGRLVVQRRGAGDAWALLNFETMRVELDALGGRETYWSGGKWVVSLSRGKPMIIFPKSGLGSEACPATLLHKTRTYLTSRLVLTNSFYTGGYISALYQSKQHGLIAQVMHLWWSSNQPPLNSFSFVSLQSHKVLYRSQPGQIYKLDNTHFAEIGTNYETLSVYSIDDFDHPVRVFLAPARFSCENGFILIEETSHIDLVDAVTGKWLLRQPTVPTTRRELRIQTS